MPKLLLVSATVLLIACSAQSTDPQPEPQQPTPTASLGRVGSAADLATIPIGGTVLMGGSTDVDSAIAWMVRRARGGDFVILRATGGSGYNSYVYGFGGLNSVETLLINSRDWASDSTVVRKVRAAEAVFIAGGDQADYVRYWKDSPLEAALNYLITTKQAPIGGTSAGCAILGGAYFDATGLGPTEALTSTEALANPFTSKLTLSRNDFLNSAYLQTTITDQHYSQRDRLGRHVVMLARLMASGVVAPRGIGVDERTAVAIDPSGVARVFGVGKAYFWKTSEILPPETLVAGQALIWDHTGTALQRYEIQGADIPTATFSVADWVTAAGGTWRSAYVRAGALSTN
jgi:cyanophycinase